MVYCIMDTYPKPLRGEWEIDSLSADQSGLGLFQCLFVRTVLNSEPICLLVIAPFLHWCEFVIICLFTIVPSPNWCQCAYIGILHFILGSWFFHSLIRVFRESETHTFLSVVHINCSAFSMCCWLLYLGRQRSERLKASLNSVRGEIYLKDIVSNTNLNQFCVNHSAFIWFVNFTLFFLYIHTWICAFFILFTKSQM